MIDTIVFDIGNVLAHFCWEDYLVDCGYSQEVIDKVSKATVLSPLWNELDRGARKEEEIFAEFVKLDPSVEKEIMAMYKDALDLVKEFDYAADFVRTLKRNGYKIYLLSNYARFTFEHAKKIFKFIQYVDGGVISYQVKYTKPEAEIYQTLIDKYKIEPKKAVFLDDLQANLEGAKPFGFHTIRVESHEQALEDLRKLGVRVD
ncbi:MAG: HAD family phosphatase [Clostridiales bacterium]|mgnify:CR=1 FL=1|jgi:putative hydrolase of the HAD superfamily|nr:HAD family phosphatase [Clostridiales bacterium]